MQIAILATSTTAMLFSIGTFVVMAKTARELRDAKDQIDNKVETFKTKTDKNIRVIKHALNDLEM